MKLQHHEIIKERYLFYKNSINLMLDVMFSKDKEIKIGNKSVNKDVLNELFFNIDYDTMLSVYTSISLNLGTIKNKKAYTLTAIYNAITTP